MLYNAVSACLESWIVRGTPASSKGKGGGAEQNASNRGSGNNIGTRHKSQHFGDFLPTGVYGADFAGSSVAGPYVHVARIRLASM